MRTRILVILVGLASVNGLAAQTPSGPTPGRDWPAFRGIASSGVAEGTPVPLRWSVPESTLVRWRVPVQGLGHSSPVVWGDHVCAASAVSGTPDPQLKVGLYGDIESVRDTTSHRWLVMCFDKKTGARRWERTAASGVPVIKRHPKSTHASSTLATDGRHLVAFFGSEGLYTYDLDGTLLWKKDFGTLDSGFFMAPEAQWGFASSPVIHGGRVIIQVDVQKGSFVAAVDVRTGRELWRTPRTDVPTWSSPAVVSMGGRDQVVVNGWKHIGGYDLETGAEVWRMTGGGDIPVPTPISGHGLVFITNAHGGKSPVYAIRPTCRRRFSTATSCMSARTTGYSAPSTRGPARATTRRAWATAPRASRRQPSPLAGACTSPARTETSMSSRRARPSRCWPPTRSAKSRWPRRPSRTAC
jgi:outer membrane protein assembly factor BamB